MELLLANHHLHGATFLGTAPQLIHRVGTALELGGGLGIAARAACLLACALIAQQQEPGALLLPLAAPVATRSSGSPSPGQRVLRDSDGYNGLSKHTTN